MPDVLSTKVASDLYTIFFLFSFVSWLALLKHYLFVPRYTKNDFGPSMLLLSIILLKITRILVQSNSLLEML